MNNEFKIYNPYNHTETTIKIDDEHDSFVVLEEKTIKTERPVPKLMPEKKAVRKKRQPKTFGKNK